MKPEPSLVLSRSDIARALTPADCIAAVEKAFAGASQSKMEVPRAVHIAAPDGAFHVKSAAYRGEPHYVAVKLNGNFPENPRQRGLPTIQGAILLSDGLTGALLSIMDSTEVTALRTGAATAVAAKYLAPRPCRSASVIGCGVQARVQLLSLLEVMAIERVYAADQDPLRARRFAENMQRETGRDIVAVNDFAEVSRRCEVIVCCTSARRAFLGRHHVAPGTFIAAVGADNHDKQEIEPDLMMRAIVVPDSTDQCAEMGDLHHAIAAGAMSRDDVVAELGEVVAGLVQPEIAAGDIVVFDSTGIAIEDVAAAGAIYERAKAAGLGVRVALN